MQTRSSSAPCTVTTLYEMKARDEKIVVVTGYDALFAHILDEQGIDVILVGDSLATVVQGHATTLPTTLDEMIYHSRCVMRGVKRAFVVGDLPFLSYQVSPEQAVLSAGRLVKEGGVHAVKLEGGVTVAPTIKRIAEADIPVVGHIGLTPQSVHRMGGYKVQGRSRSRASRSAQQLIRDALAVEAAGACAIVLEGIPGTLAKKITKMLSIPTIGIGAGVACDGQVLVLHDLLGLTQSPPRFVKQYRNLRSEVGSAIAEYLSDVKNSAFPATEHTYTDKPTARTVVKK
jgi:3-methyl-2-oxobutanoate hydroxymethyltransferase